MKKFLSVLVLMTLVSVSSAMATETKVGQDIKTKTAEIREDVSVKAKETGAKVATFTKEKSKIAADATVKGTKKGAKRLTIWTAKGLESSAQGLDKLSDKMIQKAEKSEQTNTNNSTTSVNK